MNTSNFIKYSCSNCGVCYEKNHYTKYKFNQNLKKKFSQKEFKKYCPGIGIDRKKIDIVSKSYHSYFGPINNSYVGFSNIASQRLSSSSGGVITEVIIFLLEEKIIDGVLIPFPINDIELIHQYKICKYKDIDKIRKYAQSIYKKIPAYNFKNIVDNFDGKLCFVGLPDQIAAARALCKENNQMNKKIKYFVGPMVGILMEDGALDFISKFANTNEKIKKIRWRHGEWPGNLMVKFKSKKIEIKKFYYNFLLPFYCSNESLFSDDFYNELADISVGDAWSPEYEKEGKGWSLVLAKSDRGEEILLKMKRKRIIFLKKIKFRKALRMHEHMIDFKKRGSKYRKKFLSFFGIKTPNHYNFNIKYFVNRYFIEFVILISILICKTKLARWLMSKCNYIFLGKIFSFLRINWKKMTKEAKRKGLYDNIKSN